MHIRWPQFLNSKNLPVELFKAFTASSETRHEILMQCAHLERFAWRASETPTLRTLMKQQRVGKSAELSRWASRAALESKCFNLRGEPQLVYKFRILLLGRAPLRHSGWKDRKAQQVSKHGKTLRVECFSLCSPNADRKNLVLLYKQEAQVTPSEVVEKEERRDKMFQDSTKKTPHLKQTTTLNYWYQKCLQKEWIVTWQTFNIVQNNNQK